MEHIQIKTSDGILLAATVFKANADSARQCSLIINSATGIGRKFYSRYARYMAERGFNVITYDYRGIGGSRPEKLRGYKADFVTWGAKDFSAVIRETKDLFPGNKISVLGHSIGGTIIGMTADCQEIQAVVMIGAQTAYFKDWSAPHRLKLYLLWHVLLPGLTKLFGYFPGKMLNLMEDIPAGVVRQWNERRKDPSMINQLTATNIELFYHAYKNKMLTLFIEDDFIGSHPAVNRVIELFVHADQNYVSVNPADYSSNGIGHFGFFRKEFEKKLWPKTVEWYLKAIQVPNG